MADHSSIPAGKVVSSFEHLRDFIRKRMRMSHIYQPVMIKELLTSGGKSSIRTIAAAFLARDASQLEYYEQITKDMPGKVLAKHGIVERDGKDYRLSTDPFSLSSEQRDELVRLCDEAARDDRIFAQFGRDLTRGFRAASFANLTPTVS